MTKNVVLSGGDVKLLQDVLEYIIFEDDRERIDFQNQLDTFTFGDKSIYNSVFNEWDTLNTKLVPKELQSHIFYKSSVLHQELMDSTEGGV